MPTTTITADFDCNPSKRRFSEVYTKFDSPSFLIVGHETEASNGTIRRVGLRFPTTSLPVNSNPTLAELLVTTGFQINMAGRNVRIGGYNGNGQGDVSGESAMAAYNACNVLDLGVYSTHADFQTEGNEVISIGGGVLADLASCISSQVPFILSLQLDSEIGVDAERVTLDSLADSTDKPKLRVTYNLTFSESSIRSTKNRRQLRQLLAG
jgi:hypothetical protein